MKPSHLLALLVITGFAATDATAACPGAEEVTATITSPGLKVLSLNIAHGRKDGANQMLQKSATIKRNLGDIAALLGLIEPHVIAIQEADAPSAWSGKFNHVDFIAEAAGYPCVEHGLHATNRLYDFGTA
jgi:hypothetical protein